MTIPNIHTPSLITRLMHTSWLSTMTALKYSHAVAGQNHMRMSSICQQTHFRHTYAGARRCEAEQAVEWNQTHTTTAGSFAFQSSRSIRVVNPGISEPMCWKGVMVASTHDPRLSHATTHTLPKSWLIKHLHVQEYSNPWF